MDWSQHGGRRRDRPGALERALGSDVELKSGDPLPLLGHWLYFWDVRDPSGLGADGHPATGEFLPSVRLPRRMWAGGRLTFHRPLVFGTAVTKKSTIAAVERKTGKSGELIFITVRHELGGSDGVAISEEQDLVYREAGTDMLPPPPPAPPPDASFIMAIRPDPILLFRYPALTMNSHRIHYDRRYAVEVEKYPDLVVHGPLQATLLIRAACQFLKRSVARFEFRGIKPAYDGTALNVCGNKIEGGVELWTQQGEVRNMAATAFTQGAQ